MRVVLDTNIIVSSTLAPLGAPACIINQWRQDTFDLLVSEPILSEYKQALLYKDAQQPQGCSDPARGRRGLDRA